MFVAQVQYSFALFSFQTEPQTQSIQKSLDEYSSQIGRSLQYLGKNLPLAEQIVENFAAVRSQGRQIPAALVHAFTGQLQLIKDEHERLQDTYLELKRRQVELNVSAEQLTKINNGIKSYARRIAQAEQRSPTAAQAISDYTNCADEGELRA